MSAAARTKTMPLRKRHASAIVLLAGLACLGVAACVQDRGQSAMPAASTPGFALFYMDEGASAKLAYGAPNSDDVGLMMECAKGSHVVDLSDAARAGGAASKLILASNGRKTAIPTATSMGDGAPLLTARISSDSAPLQAFRRSGKIDVAYGETTYGIAASASERAGVERFFAACDHA